MQNERKKRASFFLSMLNFWIVPCKWDNVTHFVCYINFNNVSNKNEGKKGSHSFIHLFDREFVVRFFFACANKKEFIFIFFCAYSFILAWKKMQRKKTPKTLNIIHVFGCRFFRLHYDTCENMAFFEQVLN